MIDYREIKGRNMQMAKYIPNYVFYIPFTYVTIARMGTFAKSFSLFLIYVIPTFYFFLLINDFEFSVVPTYLLAFSLIYTLYEMGYIQNDTETIKKEKNPSIWLWSRNFDYYQQHCLAIYIVRISIAILLSLLLIYYNGLVTGTFVFLCMAWAITLIYQIYNRIRSRWSLLLFAMLQICRYTSYMVLVIPDINWLASLSLFVSFPFCYIIERSSHPRFNLKLPQIIIPNTKFLTKYRVLYYFFATMVFIIMYLFDFIPFSYGVLFFYFLFYRLIILLFVKYIKPKNYLIR